MDIFLIVNSQYLYDSLNNMGILMHIKLQIFYKLLTVNEYELAILYKVITKE